MKARKGLSGWLAVMAVVATSLAPVIEVSAADRPARPKAARKASQSAAAARRAERKPLRSAGQPEQARPVNSDSTEDSERWISIYPAEK